MAAPTYTARVLVLRKTKLKEADLILTMLAADGSQIRAVAKGARKPKSSFASRLELFSVADVLLVRGKSLDIVKEARLIEGFSGVRSSIEKAACASPAVELLEKVSDQGLEYPKLFDMSQAALRALESTDVAHSPAICAGHLLKSFAFTGFAPTFSRCCLCSGDIARAGEAHFSLENGGAQCASCATSDAMRLPATHLAWADALLHSTFSDIVDMPCDQEGVFGALRIAQSWARYHVGSRIKSLEFLFSCGLF